MHDRDELDEEICVALKCLIKLKRDEKKGLRNENLPPCSNGENPNFVKLGNWGLNSIPTSHIPI